MPNLPPQVAWATPEDDAAPARTLSAMDRMKLKRDKLQVGDARGVDTYTLLGHAPAFGCMVWKSPSVPFGRVYGHCRFASRCGGA